MSSHNISAVFLQGLLNYENELNILLSPPNDLRGDVRELAGSLGFQPDEISRKEYPFLYLLDVWIQKVGAEAASLQILHSKLIELERPDAAEIVKNAIDYLNEQNPRQLNIIADRFNGRLKRSTSTYSLCPSFKQCTSHESNEFVEENNNSDLEDADSAPSVYVVCSSSESKCLQQIEDIVDNLRTLGVNAKADIFDTAAYENQGYYIYRNLIDTERVLYLCPPSSRRDDTNSEQSEEDTRKADFILKFITDFLYDKGPYKSKYLPVLLPGSTLKDIPFILSGFISYDMNDVDFYKKLQHIIFKVEQFQLSPVKKGFKFKPKII